MSIPAFTEYYIISTFDKAILYDMIFLEIFNRITCSYDSEKSRQRYSRLTLNFLCHFFLYLIWLNYRVIKQVLIKSLDNQTFSGLNSLQQL